MLYDVNTSCPSDSSLCHHAKVSLLPNAYCVTSDNDDNSAGLLLVLRSLLQHEDLWQVRTPHFTEETERKPYFLPERLLCIGKEPPTRLTRAHSKTRKDALRKQPLLETATFLRKLKLPAPVSALTTAAHHRIIE